MRKLATALGLCAALSTGATTPMGALAAQIYALYNARGDGGMDFSGIIEMLRGSV